MGCTQSKIENEEAVSRCKDRKQHMKDAVSQRNAFAAAHSAYAMSLKNTGAALSDYAHGEVQNPQFSSSSAPTTTSTQPPFSSQLPPPPPLPDFPPLQRAATMPEFIPKVELKHTDTIIEEENDEDVENYEQSTHLKQRSRSSRRSSGGNTSGNVVVDQEDEEGPLPPPSPPPPKAMGERGMAQPVSAAVSETNQVWDYFFPEMENIPRTSLSEEVRVNEESEQKVFDELSKRGEIERKEVDEMSKKSEIERKGFDERSKKGEDGIGEIIEGRKSVKGDGDVVEKAVAPMVPVKNVKKVKQAVGAGSVVEVRRGGKGNVNLLQIFVDLDDHFLKASESAHEVSKMLEATRLHYHSNFADNRGHIDHSARVMRVITWNRSFKGLPNVDDGKDDYDAEEHETHATVLDKLLAWEKKLYDEVKAGELMKFEYQRKVAILNKQKKRSTNSEALEKTKAAVGHLHTRYIVDMQSMDSTVSEINRLRDDQLYPKLVALVDGMATMWEAMQAHHESQSKIVTALRSLDISQSPKETSEHHHERTIQLWNVVRGWHAQFEKLMDHQKEYIKALNSWLKLNLIPIESSLKEKVSSPPRIQKPPIQSLLHEWHGHLDKLPDELARSAVSSFAAVIETIMQLQEEEMKLKIKCEDTRNELNRKTRQFEDWYHKYMQRKTPEEVDAERAEDSSQKDFIAEKQLVVYTVKKRLEEEEEAYQKQCLHVREKSLVSLRTRLPELFRAMSGFSLACSDMYRNLRSISQSGEEAA